MYTASGHTLLSNDMFLNCESSSAADLFVSEFRASFGVKRFFKCTNISYMVAVYAFQCDCACVECLIPLFFRGVDSKCIEMLRALYVVAECCALRIGI